MSVFISRTPLRVSFFGGGTDYKWWAKKNGSNIISTTIDKYIYVYARFHPEFYENDSRIIYKDVEVVKKFEEIDHPVVRGALKYLKFKNNKGIEFYYQGDLPASSGLGSSSAFSVGTINCLSRLKGEEYSSRQLAEKAIFLEQKLLKETVGFQDQIATAHGGFNHIKIDQKLDFSVKAIKMSNERKNLFNSSLVLIHSGSFRSASNIASKLVLSMKDRSETLKRIDKISIEAKKIFESSSVDNFDEIGYLLNETWYLKKSLSKVVSNKRIDNIYKLAMKNGALGGKLLGAGSSGFLLFYVNKKNKKKFNEVFRKFKKTNFSFDNSGSKVFFIG